MENFIYKNHQRDFVLTSKNPADALREIAELCKNIIDPALRGTLVMTTAPFTGRKTLTLNPEDWKK